MDIGKNEQMLDSTIVGTNTLQIVNSNDAILRDSIYRSKMSVLFNRESADGVHQSCTYQQTSDSYFGTVDHEYRFALALT